MQIEVPVGIGQYGGRFIPRSTLLYQNDNLTSAFRYINENGGQVTVVGLNVSKAVVGNVYNSVNPAWRDALLDVTVSTCVSPKRILYSMEKSLTALHAIDHGITPHLLRI